MSAYKDWAPRIILDRYGREVEEAGHSWRLHTFRALLWLYGSERAQRIIEGNDPLTQADVARWNALGNPKDAA